MDNIKEDNLLTADELLQTLDFSKKNHLVATQYNQGFMTTKLDNFSEAFVECAAQRQGWSLDIGAAYGVATLSALKNGAKIIANDLYGIHLEVLKILCPRELTGNLQLKTGRLPEALNIETNSIETVLASRVLHFMDGPELLSALQSIYVPLLDGNNTIAFRRTL